MNKKSQHWTLLAALLIISLLLPACGSAVPVTGGDTIKIGAALCLTGIQAPLDEPALKGAQVAVDEINKKGGVLGKQLELINLDCKSDPVTTGNVAVQLIDQGAKAIIAPSDFDFGGPASREAQKAGLVGISPAASSPFYGSKALGDKQFTMSMWNTTMGAAAAQSAREQGWKTAYVVTDDFIQYTKDLGEYFTKAWEAGGGTILYQEKYTQGAADFSAQLARMKALPKQPDFYYISSYMPDLGLIIRTMREAGITQPIMGGDSYDDPGLFKALGPEYGNDIIFATHTWVSPDTSPQMAEFLKAYDAKFGGPPEAMWAATGWDVVHILAGAMEKAGSTDGAAMAKVMEDNKWDLLTGTLDWEPAAKGHETHKQAAMVKLVAGKPEFIGWLLPESQPAP
ncbi:MAG TPA: ABC transporter substrate-binding protein [Anaerolineales bacterium]|nr:ABC transporter substrate-binding protein [Anaerolineales bacterium]